MTKREAMRLAHQENALLMLGFTPEEAEKLRRISMTLRRWYEAECNGDIQREDITGITFRHYGHGTSGPFQTVRCADRETGAKKRLAAILERRNSYGNETLHANGSATITARKPVTAYIQGDPRGAALYIIRPGDVPAGADVGAYYTRGICVY